MQHPPPSASVDADPPSQEELRRLLGPVLNKDDTYKMRQLGRIETRKQCHLWLTSREEAIWHCLATNGGGFLLHRAAIAYKEHGEQKTRERGGRIETTTTYHGETTTTVREYPPPKVAQTGRVRATPRAARPRERRAGASSRTSSQDPGDSDLPPRAPRLALARPARTVYAFGCLSPAERGEVTERVSS